MSYCNAGSFTYELGQNSECMCPTNLSEQKVTPSQSNDINKRSKLVSGNGTYDPTTKTCSDNNTKVIRVENTTGKTNIYCLDNNNNITGGYDMMNENNIHNNPSISETLSSTPSGYIDTNNNRGAVNYWCVKDNNE